MQYFLTKGSNNTALTSRHSFGCAKIGESQALAIISTDVCKRAARIVLFQVIFQFCCLICVPGDSSTCICVCGWLRGYVNTTERDVYFNDVHVLTAHKHECLEGPAAGEVRSVCLSLEFQENLLFLIIALCFCCHCTIMTCE